MVSSKRTVRRISSLQRLIYLMMGVIGGLVLVLTWNFVRPHSTVFMSAGTVVEDPSPEHVSGHTHGHGHGHGHGGHGINAPTAAEKAMAVLSQRFDQQAAAGGGDRTSLRGDTPPPVVKAPEPVPEPQPEPQPVPEPEPVPEPPVVQEETFREGTRIEFPNNALDHAKENIPGGPTEWDERWAKIRAKRRFAGIHRDPEPEPFMAEGMKDWTLFKTPDNAWFDKAKALLEARKGELTAPDEPGLTEEVTIVTTLLDLKRGSDTGQMFRRSMKEYFGRFNYILDCGFKMVIFMPHEFKEHLHIKDNRMTIIHMTGQDIETYFPYYKRLQEVRLSPLWRQQAKHIGWLWQSPQASLPGYDPLVMSKPFLLRDAIEMNPYNTKYHVFLDSGHMCAGAQNPNFMDVYREHMDRGYLVTHWPYGTNSEVHGMCDKAMHIYTGMKDPLRIVRGGVFGTTKQYADIVTDIYDLALADTLSDGYMGTEENILAIIYARFHIDAPPGMDLFAGYDNNQWGDHGDNCAIFNHQSRIRKEAVAKGLTHT